MSGSASSEHDVYRICASVVLLRKKEAGADGVPTAYEVLLLRKPRKRDAWQLPQGGAEEGETVEQAALRELHEEAGIHARVIGRSTKVYEYEFPASYRRFRPDNVRGQRISFVFVTQDDNQPVQVDNKEITAYAWVSLEQVPVYLKRKRYMSLVHELLTEALHVVDAKAAAGYQAMPHKTSQGSPGARKRRRRRQKGGASRTQKSTGLGA